MNRRCGIYRVLCENNERIYFGQTSNFKQRSAEHLSKLRGNSHENIHLQRAFNKYGEDSFVFEFIEEVPEQDLTKVEQEYLNSRPWRELFNICKVAAKPPSAKGRKWSEEQRKAISERVRGEKNGMYGRKHTEEAKRRMSEYRKGRSFNLTSEQREKRRERMLGESNPSKRKDVRLKMSKAKRSWTFEESKKMYEEWISTKYYRGKIKYFSEKYSKNRKIIKRIINSYINEKDM